MLENKPHASTSQELPPPKTNKVADVVVTLTPSQDLEKRDYVAQPVSTLALIQLSLFSRLTSPRRRRRKNVMASSAAVPSSEHLSLAALRTKNHDKFVLLIHIALCVLFNRHSI